MTTETSLKEQILARVRFDNPWWTTKQIPDDYRAMKPRLYFDTFYPLVVEKQVRRSVILMGPRRVGKTVMLFHCIQKLIDNGVNPQKIVYLSIDTPIYNNIGLEDLFNIAREILQDPDPNEYYIIFDEIQYLKDWEVHLKSLTDSYRNTRFVASGSAAAALKMKSAESGAGRFSDFMLPPLTFNEYLHLLDLEGLIRKKTMMWKGLETDAFDTIDIEELNRQFINYINYGGYPEITLSKGIKSNPGQYIRSDIVDKVLLRDLPSLYGIQDIQELNRLFVHISYRSGSEFSYEALSKESNIKKETLKRYLQYLEAAFLIKIVYKIDACAKKMQRVSAFKVYLTNPSLRCALFSPLNDGDTALGGMVETAIYSQWFQRDQELYYANWRQGKNEGEVDIVKLDELKLKPSWIVEVKWSDRYYRNPGDLDSLASFMEKNKMDDAIVTSKTASGLVEYKNRRLLFIPSALYAYLVGYRTIQKGLQRDYFDPIF